jgi:hypothetical protein
MLQVAELGRVAVVIIVLVGYLDFLFGYLSNLSSCLVEGAFSIVFMLSPFVCAMPEGRPSGQIYLDNCVDFGPDFACMRSVMQDERRKHCQVVG